MEFVDKSSTTDKPSPAEEVLGREMGGFDFSLSLRDSMLAAATGGAAKPKMMKTGTTICGVVFKNGVVLGADTRATEDTVISDKNCAKIHYMAPNIYCCGAGTAADTENITLITSSQLELLRLATRTSSRVVTAMTLLKRRLFQYQGHISAALVLGGVDATGPHLYNVYPHGSTDKLPFAVMGSGTLPAMAVFESGYKDDMTEEEAKALVQAAIRAGIFNDLGSGSNVDLCVIRGNDADPKAAPTVTYLRNHDKPNEVKALRDSVVRPKARTIPVGATVVIREGFEPAVRPLDLSRTAAKAGSTGGAGGVGAAAAGLKKMDLEE